MKNIRNVIVQNVKKEDCIHRGAYRRVPEIDGGLGLCPNLKGE